MSVNFKIYVPAEHTFRNYFLPKIKNPTLEHFEVDAKRIGIQRKGNNHLVVFLDYHGKKNSSRFTEVREGSQGEFFMKSAEEVDLFNAIFGSQKEVAVFSVACNAKMSVFAWKVLTELVDDEKIMVEDEKSHLMRGPDCAKSLGALLGRV